MISTFLNLIENDKKVIENFVANSFMFPIHCVCKLVD